MQEEIWKDLPNYEGLYQASNLGNIKSLSKIVIRGNVKQHKKEIILKQHKGVNGYFIVRLNNNKKGKTFKVSTLIAMAFLNHNPCGYKLVVDHINNIKTDNRIENLQLLTNRENTSKDKKNCSSIYTGVSFDKKNNKWISSIKINNKSKHLGRFKTEIEASKAYMLELNKLKNA